LNSYRDYIDEQERTCMTEDEKSEKKNREILSLYITARNKIIPEHMIPKVESVNLEPEKHKKNRS